jgi:hypothetical protein
MDSCRLYWGDFHTHFDDLQRADSLLRDARDNVDFCTVLCYPFGWEKKNGLRVETTGQRPEFLTLWERLRDLAREHHDPGRFVTFLGYEWHGDRTRWGDHNVIYFDEDNPLDDARTLAQLYANLRQRRAIAIPHHTGYLPGWRGKDWEVWDEALSPVMEVFSAHGSSEGCSTPRPLQANSSMGPRTTGGTFADALARGYRIGVIASNDHAGLPGRWGLGRAGVWAHQCTREAIWEALLSRRTFAVTGDRIELDFRIDGAPMGSVIRGGAAVDAQVTVVGSHAIDRLEVLHNGYVADTYCHSGRWERDALGSGRVKVLVEMGWGPAADYGYQPSDWQWDGSFEITAGRLVGVERCFSLPGQQIESQDENHCAWRLSTAGRKVRDPFGMTQGIVFEVEPTSPSAFAKAMSDKRLRGPGGAPETRLRLRIEGIEFDFALADILKGSHLIPLIDESKRRTRETFGLAEADLPNHDTYYHNARKIKMHRGIPESGYRVTHVFRDLKLARGRNHLYVRASQLNGQLAWSSPIWVDCE